MIFQIFEVDENTVVELDAEGIDWLMQGLEQLRDTEPGHTVMAPTLVAGGDGQAAGVGEFVLLRAESDPPAV